MHFCYKVFCVIFLLMHIPGNVRSTIDIFDPLGKKVETFQAGEALFYDIPDKEGFIVLADPSDACIPIVEPIFLTNFTFGRFVLINGSEEKCSIENKWNNAKSANYDFAVIFGCSLSTSLHFLKSHSITMPVVLLSLEDGLKIQNNYLFNSSNPFNYHIRIYPILSKTTFWFVIVGCCFSFIFCMFKATNSLKNCVARRIERIRNDRISNQRRGRLSSQEVNRIPTATFTTGDRYDLCVICRENYIDGDKLRILPCSHAYHAECLDPWLMHNSKKCPLCKRIPLVKSWLCCWRITSETYDDDSDSLVSEMFNPSETTPLFTTPPSTSVESESKSMHASNWTFGVAPGHNYGTHAIAGPSSLPNYLPVFSHDLRFPSEQVSQTVTNLENLLSDSESEGLVAPPQQSVNNGQQQSSRNPVVVHINVSSLDHSDSIN